MSDAVTAWARAAGVRWSPGAARPTGDFRSDPRLDFGRVVTRTPAWVLHPADVDQLAATMRFLGDHGIPFTTRGAAHSVGGQVLIDGGAVIDVRGLSRIVADDPAAETLTVEGGAWWLAVVDHLAGAGRRPAVVTDNARTTIGGTLAVGGFGDSTHRLGIQAEHVPAMTVVTLDGERHAVRPGDPLFDYTLCGRGQLGVIAEATLATVRRTWQLRGRMLGWYTLPRFLDGAARIREHQAFDFLRARLQWQPGLPVIAIAGDLADAITPLAPIGPDDATALEPLDLYALVQDDPHARWAFASPALELVLPLPSGVATLQRLADAIVAAELHTRMPRGASIMVVRRPPALPLAPFPASELALVVALRLELPIADAARAVPVLEQLGRRAMDEGARCYLMSIELPGDDFLERQFGAALPALRALKDRHDPRRLLNPWRL